MAVKAVGFIRDFDWGEGGLTVRLDICTSDLKHYNVDCGTYSPSGAAATINTQIVAAVKDYAENSMSETFGIGDTAKLMTGIDLL